MNNHLYQTGGALSANSPVYIWRQADDEAVKELRKREMSYLHLIEPRQQGKTSLIMRLHQDLSKEEYEIIWISVEDFNYSNQEAWYRDLWFEIDNQLSDLVGQQKLDHSYDSHGWRTGLRQLAKVAQELNKSLDFALDEIG